MSEEPEFIVLGLYKHYFIGLCSAEPLAKIYLHVIGSIISRNSECFGCSTCSYSNCLVCCNFATNKMSKKAAALGGTNILPNESYKMTNKRTFRWLKTVC